MKKTNFSIYMLAVLPMLFWSLSFVWVKVALEYYQPLTIIFLRLLLSVILLSTFMKWQNKFEPIARKDIPVFLLLAFCEPFCYFLGETFGMQYVSATVGAIMVSTIPVFTPIFAFLLLKERLSRINIIGVVVSFVGVVLILAEDLQMSASMKGIGLLFLAVLSGVMYGITVKNLTMKYSSLTIVNTQSALGALYFFPLFVVFDSSHFATVRPTLSLIGTLVMLSVFCSVLAFIFITTVIRHIGVSRTNLFTNLVPVFTAIFSYFILGELFSVRKAIGIAIVIGGLFLAQQKMRKTPKELMVEDSTF